jgi:putative ABC transport system permease protein
MSVFRQILSGLRALVRPAATDRDIADEVEHYLAEATAAYREQGLSDHEARRAAQLDLGSRTAVRQQIRAAGWEQRIECVVVDLYRSIRRLKRSPAFATVTAATLALGIGASTAMFSIVRPVLLQSLPYPEADRLVTIADASGPEGTPIDVTFGTFREIGARSRSLRWAAVTRPWQPTLNGFGEAERLDGQSVSADYFRTLGVHPVLGRDLSPADDVPGAPQVAIVTDGLWRRRFGADPTLVGRVVSLDGAAVTIVGVMPRTFENVWNARAQIWRPLGYDPSLPLQGREWGHHLQMIARLGSDDGLFAARDELAVIARTPVSAFARPAWAALRRGFTIAPLQDRVTAGVTPTLRAVTIGTLLLLLIAAVNIVNLMLARGVERRTELSICAALGASRARLLSPLLAEGLVLALLGGTLGVALAYAMVDAMVTVEGMALPRLEAIRVDRSALVFAAALSAAIGIAAGCIPGLVLSRRLEATRPGPRVIAGHHRLRRAFVAAEVALAMVLLVGAGLLVRTVQRLLEVPAGFRPEGVLTLQVQTSGPQFRSADTVRAFFERVREAARGVPGVASAALTSQLPLTGDGDIYGAGTKDDSVLPPGADPSAYRYAVSADYLETMGIALERGRTIDGGDRTGGQPVALISESVAQRRFPGRDPIGAQLRLGPADNWFTVVGVVGNVKQSSLAAASPDAVYVPEAQWRFADRVMWVVIRTTVDPQTIERAVRQAIRDVDPNQPIVHVATMEQRVAASMARQRLAMGAFYAFAAVALLLATIGIYGVLAAGVMERTREIAIKTAVGASRASIASQVGRQAIGMAAIGMVIGGFVAGGLSRGLAALLFEVSPLDGLTYVGVAVLLLAAAAVSAIVPAWRAARIAPAIALQSP